MGAQNFNFDPKFLKITVFQPQSLHFSTKNFWQEEDFPTAQNLGACLWPRRHWLPSSTRLPPCPSWSPAPLNWFYGKRKTRGNFLQVARMKYSGLHRYAYVHTNSKVPRGEEGRGLFSPNAGGIVLDHMSFRFWISLSVPEIFAIELWSGPKSTQLLHVVGPQLFGGGPQILRPS